MAEALPVGRGSTENWVSPLQEEPAVEGATSALALKISTGATWAWRRA